MCSSLEVETNPLMEVLFSPPKISTFISSMRCQQPENVRHPHSEVQKLQI